MLEALQYCQRAMEVGNVHGISSLQCSGSSTAGKVMMEIGMGDVGVPCLRRALHLSEDRESELINLQCLTKALIETNALEEAAELLVRFRAAGKAESQRGGNISIWELDSLQASALLHEARGKPSEAADDVRALLLCVHEIEARHLPGVTPRLLHNLLSDAASSLKQVLDLDSGDRQLAQSVAARLARLASQMRQ
ncbi:hypothetical protein T484DRAFT_2621518 [Baffinella frigidus]|nr:hypothetical protein T484DRAFT_2621518 [Cryptophyta sp. CCMP2293]